MEETINTAFNFFIGEGSSDKPLSLEEKISALNKKLLEASMQTEGAARLEAELNHLRGQLAAAQADASAALAANCKIQCENAALREQLQASEAREREASKNLWGFLERVVTIR